MTSGEKVIEIPSGEVVDDTRVLPLVKPPNSARADITPKEMLVELLRVAAPSVASLVFMFATQTITMSFVGHRLGVIALAQFSVGLSVFNVMGSSIGIGFGGALDTLVPQAYGRDPQTSDIGDLLQRATLINIMFIIPLAILYYNVDPLLHFVYSDTLASGAAMFLKVSPPYMFLVWTGTNFNRLFAGQQLADVPLYCNIVGTLAAFAINYNFLKEGDTVSDAVWLLFFIQLVIVACQIAAARFHPKSIIFNTKFSTKTLFDVSALKDHFRIGFAAMIGTCSEWWAFEVLQVLSAQIGEVEVAAYTIMLNTMLIYFSMACGISIGGGTMIGNALGANQPELGRKYLMLTFKISAACTALTFGSLVFFGMDIVKLYTNDEPILAMIRPIILLACFWHLGDATQSTMQGVFRGAGKQQRSATMVLVSLWAVGVPLAAAMGLWAGFGLPGIIGGQLTGVCILIPLLLYDCLRWDWKTLAEIASREAAVEAIRSLPPSPNLTAVPHPNHRCDNGSFNSSFGHVPGGVSRSPADEMARGMFPPTIFGGAAAFNAGHSVFITAMSEADRHVELREDLSTGVVTTSS